MPNETTLQKIVGDPTDEVPEAAYRLVARVLVIKVADKAIDSIVKDENIKSFLKKHQQIGEIVVGSALAMALEFLRIIDLDDERKRLAYNLRVQSYEEIGELALSFISLPDLLPFKSYIEEEVRNAIRLAKVNLNEEEVGGEVEEGEG